MRPRVKYLISLFFAVRYFPVKKGTINCIGNTIIPILDHCSLGNPFSINFRYPEVSMGENPIL